MNIKKKLKKIFVTPMLVPVAGPADNICFTHSWCYGGESK